MKKHKSLLSIVFSLATIALTLTVATVAYFSDTERSQDNTLAAGAIDLKVNDSDDPGILVSIDDLKPGDNYYFDKELRVVNNPAKLYMQITDLVSDQGTQTEPEDEEESQNGVKHDIQSVLEYDLMFDGEVIFDASEHKALESLSDCWIPLGNIDPSTTYDMEQSFHMPTSVTNWAQGDTLNFNEYFHVVQQRYTGDYQPDGTASVWDRNLRECVAQPPTFSDDFDDGDADGWWLGYALSNPSVWGNWRVENGTLVQDQNGDSYAALVEDHQLGNQVVETDLKIHHNGYGGLILWYQDNLNYVIIKMFPAANYIQIADRENGVFNSMQITHIAPGSVWRHMKAEADSASGVIDLYVDGSHVLTYTVSTPNHFGKSGVETGNAGASFDNFMITTN